MQQENYFVRPILVLLQQARIREMNQISKCNWSRGPNIFSCQLGPRLLPVSHAKFRFTVGTFLKLQCGNRVKIKQK